MPKAKQPNHRKSRFVLEEENGVVLASLLDENDYSLQHTIHGMPNPRVRAPRRSKEQIADDSHFMASIEHVAEDEFLEQNIEAANQEINEQVQEIRKTLKRIQSITHYVLTAKEVLNELRRKT